MHIHTYQRPHQSDFKKSGVRRVAGLKILFFYIASVSYELPAYKQFLQIICLYIL